MPLQTVLFCSQKVAQDRQPLNGWAMISITNSGDARTNLKDGWEQVLRLEFDDIDTAEEPFALFSEQHARCVIQFAHQCHKEKIEGILVHCTAGVSRSAAVAKWIADCYQLPFNEKYMLYNKHVHKVLRDEYIVIENETDHESPPRA